MADLLARLTTALADRYRVERQLGAGGMATVYLAEDLKHARKVAVKLLRPELAQTLGPDRFLREIEIAARLNHPNILTLIDSGEADDFLYFVMPYVEGETLRTRMRRDGPLPILEVVRLGREIVDALAHAHRHAVVHRDVKPDNVMLTEGHAVVTDFGVAKAVSAATGRHEVTTAGVTLGTPMYMAPEQAVAEATIDHRADIYAVGVMLYEMLAGTPPFTGATTQEVLSAHVLQTPEPIARRRDALPAGLADLVMRCLAKRREERWQSAEELRAALDDVVTPVEGSVAVRGKTPKTTWPALARWAVVAGVVGVLAVITLWIASGDGADETGGDAVSQDVVVVLPFAVRGSDELAYLGEGMVSLLSRKLDGAGDLRSVDPRALLGHIEREDETLDPVAGRRIARRFDAGMYVIGDVLEVGGRVQVGAALYGTAGGPDPLGEATAEGTADDVFLLVDRVAADLLGSVKGPGTRMRQLASVTTSSLPALKAYLECESLYRRGHYLPAIAACQRAIAEDSSYALAWYRLSIAAEWATLPDLAMLASREADARSGQLAERDRQMIRALRAFRLGQRAEAEGLYRTLVRAYPDDVEAWHYLGEVLFHGNPFHGESLAESREAFERVLVIEPEQALAVVHLARTAAMERRFASLDSLVTRYISTNPEGDRELEMLALQAFAHGDDPRRDDVVRRLEQATDPTLALAAWDVGVWTDNLDGSVRVSRLLTAPSRPPEVRATGRGMLAHFSLAGGRWSAAREHIRAMEQFDPALALEYRALLWSLPFVPASRDTLRALRAALDALETDTIPENTNPNTFFRVEPWGHRMLRAYLLGLLSARLADSAAAERYARRLEELVLPPRAGTFRTDFATAVRAHLALARGDSARSRELLAATRRQVWYVTTFASPVHSQALERFTLAELLKAAGRGAEAEGWYSHIAEVTPYEVVYRPWAHLGLAEMAERRSDWPAARAHYERFLEIWRDADPGLQHWADSARTRLQSIGR